MGEPNTLAGGGGGRRIGFQLDLDVGDPGGLPEKEGLAAATLTAAERIQARRSGA